MSRDIGAHFPPGSLSQLCLIESSMDAGNVLNLHCTVRSPPAACGLPSTRNVASATEEMNFCFYLPFLSCRAVLGRLGTYPLTGGCARGNQVPRISGWHPASPLASGSPQEEEEERPGPEPEPGSARRRQVHSGGRGDRGRVSLADRSPAFSALPPRSAPSPVGFWGGAREESHASMLSVGLCPPQRCHSPLGHDDRSPCHLRSARRAHLSLTATFATPAHLGCWGR